ncbi:MAG: hypothetical protein WBL61_17930 [Bryobacteraceae bacterium]
MVTGNGGSREFFSVTIPVLQLILYCALTFNGDFEVRRVDEYLESAARNGVAIDIGIRSPLSHQVSFGLNLPATLVAALAIGRKGHAASAPPPDISHEVGLQVLLGAFVPVLWFVVVRWGFTTRERLRSSPRKTKSVRPTGMLSVAVAVALVLWVFLHAHSAFRVPQVFAVCWVAFGAFVVTATVQRPKAVGPASDVK